MRKQFFKFFEDRLEGLALVPAHDTTPMNGDRAAWRRRPDLLKSMCKLQVTIKTSYDRSPPAAVTGPRSVYLWVRAHASMAPLARMFDNGRSPTSNWRWTDGPLETRRWPAPPRNASVACRRGMPAPATVATVPKTSRNS